MRWLFILACFFSQFVFSADYFWRGPLGDGPDPAALCPPSDDQQKPVTFSHIQFFNSTTFSCHYFTYSASPPATRHRHYVVRMGDSCPPSTVYNPSNGICESLRDDCPVGDFSIFSSSSSSVVSSGGLNYVTSSMSSSTCYNRCSYSVSSIASSCYFDKGSTTSGFCNYTGSSTGEGCNNKDASLGAVGDVLNPPDTPDVQPSDPNDPGCPSGYSWTGSFCAKDSTPGDGDGGGDGGGTDPGGGDGGGTGPGGGGGTGPGGGDGGGTGPGGDGDGEGGGTGPGGGGGTGPGEGEGEGEGDSSVGGEACNQPLVCDGDAIQCAILRSNKSQACQFQYDASVKKAISDELAGDAYKLKEEKIDVSNFFTDALNKGRWLPSSCPPPEFFTVMGRSFSIQWEPLCRFASSIAPIIVAMASIFFAIFVSRGLKGS